MKELAMKNSFDIKIAQTAEEISAAMDLRRQIFVKEEGVPEDKEFDNNDFIGCTHFYATDDNGVIGCLRARFFNGFAKLERLCCKKEYRKTPLASQLMEYAFSFCELNGYDKAIGYCTEPLLPYWEKSGFHVIKDIPLKKVGNMELYTIQKDLNPSANGISISRPETLVQSEQPMADKNFVGNKISHLLQAIYRNKTGSKHV